MIRIIGGMIGLGLMVTIMSCGRFLKGTGVGHSVTVAKVETRRTSPEITVATTLIPSERVTISVPGPTRIRKFFAQVGSRVVKDDPLLELDDSSLRTQLQQANAKRQEAKSLLDQNRFLLENREKLRAEGKLSELQAAGLEKEVAVNEATITRLEAETAAVEQALIQGTVASPIDGMILDRLVGPGQEIAANQPILEIVNINPILATFRLSADESGGIAVGDVVQVRIDELQHETVQGTVTYVGPELHAGDSRFTVWASIANPLEILKSGMHAFTEFRSTKAHDVHIVPSSAIIMRQNRPYLFVIQDGMAKLIRAQLKAITEHGAILIGGVAKDQYVVVKGQEGLDDGAVVDVR